MNDSSTSQTLPSGTWALDPTATSIGFSAKMFLGLKAKGQFSRYDATVTVGDSASNSSVAVTIQSDSIDTGIKMRDAHLRADNVFDSARFPVLEFHSTVVTETPTGLDVTGNLRVRDVTRSISFHAVRVAESASPRYTAEVRISPKDFGITRPGTTKPLDVLIDATLRRS